MVTPIFQARSPLEEMLAERLGTPQVPGLPQPNKLSDLLVDYETMATIPTIEPQFPGYGGLLGALGQGGGQNMLPGLGGPGGLFSSGGGGGGGFGGLPSPSLGGGGGGGGGGYGPPQPATNYTGGATGFSGSYSQPGPLYNGDPGSMRDYGLDMDSIITKQGLTGVKPAINTLLEAERELGLPNLSNVTGSFRTRAQQIAMDPDGDGYGSSGQLVAPPGSSMHEAGRAFDIATEFLMAHPELRRFLDQEGWVNAVSGEPWHWEYQGPLTPTWEPSWEPSFKPEWSPGQGGGGGGGGTPSSPSRSYTPRDTSGYSPGASSESAPRIKRRRTVSAAEVAARRNRRL